MLVIGLTGSIGTGKSTVAAQFAQFGAKTISADTIVHRLLAKGGKAVGEIKRHFPSVVKKDAVDRGALGDIVFADDQKRALLEQLLHPMVMEAEARFVAYCKRKGAKIVVLDIPLLFETGAERRCDVTVVTVTPPALQRQRVMRRTFMTEEKYGRILALQMPDREKCARADFIVHTGMGKAYSLKRVRHILRTLNAT